jgi:hypothetical protein
MVELHILPCIAYEILYVRLILTRHFPCPDNRTVHSLGTSEKCNLMKFGKPIMVAHLFSLVLWAKIMYEIRITPSLVCISLDEELPLGEIHEISASLN